mmetsp:Transcript_15470/g.62259  ORF Transcript_15470/g.62259 Transcript_15470/m.62259 type:complete len:200 (-) Transcript_15470:59-658(-)
MRLLVVVVGPPSTHTAHTSRLSPPRQGVRVSPLVTTSPLSLLLTNGHHIPPFPPSASLMPPAVAGCPTSPNSLETSRRAIEPRSRGSRTSCSFRAPSRETPSAVGCTEILSKCSFRIAGNASELDLPCRAAIPSAGSPLSSSLLRVAACCCTSFASVFLWRFLHSVVSSELSAACRCVHDLRSPVVLDRPSPILAAAIR